MPSLWERRALHWVGKKEEEEEEEEEEGGKSRKRRNGSGPSSHSFSSSDIGREGSRKGGKVDSNRSMSMMCFKVGRESYSLLDISDFTPVNPSSK